MGDDARDPVISAELAFGCLLCAGLLCAVRVEVFVVLARGKLVPFLGLSIIIGLIAIVHVIKTGRSQLWIMVLLAVPVFGAAAYFIVEVLPELRSGRGGQNVSRSVDKVLNPNRSLDDAKHEYEISNTVENTCNLADAYLLKDQYAEASELYRGVLTGLNENNPDILNKLASSEFGLGDFKSARSLLDRLIKYNPHYKNQDAHLLYARSLQELGENAEANEEYEALVKYYTGPEPAVRFGLFLQAQGDEPRAKELFSQVVKKSELSPSHYRKMHSQWIGQAKSML